MRKLQLNLSNELYHSSPGLSSSQVKMAIDNIEMFAYSVVDKKIKNEFKESYKIGNYFHERVLEPHLYNPIVLPEHIKDKRGKPYREWREDNPDVDLNMLLKQKDLSKLDEMYATLESYKEVADLFKGSTNEASLFYKRNILGTDFDLRVRPDAFIEKDAHIIDLKTTALRKLTPRTIKYTINDFGYDLSSYMYTTAMSQHFNKPYKFSWVFVQTCAPYSVAMYTMTSELFELGKFKFKKAFENIIRYQETGIPRNQLKPELLGEDKTVYFST